jgi:glycerophosphoryl diester phosphodiesterase
VGDAVDAELVGRAHGLGLAVNTWTVNDPDRIRALRDLGVDAVVSDVPDEALAALGRTPDRRPGTSWGTRA